MKQKRKIATPIATYPVKQKKIKVKKLSSRAISESIIVSVISYTLLTYLRDMSVLTGEQFIGDLDNCNMDNYSKDIQFIILQGRKVGGIMKRLSTEYIQVGLKNGDQLLNDIEEEADLEKFKLAYSNYVFGICLLNLYLEHFNKPSFNINVKLTECTEAYDFALNLAFEDKQIMKDLTNDTIFSVYFFDRALKVHKGNTLEDYKQHSYKVKERLRECLKT